MKRAKSVFMQVDESTNRKVKTNMMVCVSFIDPDTGEYHCGVLCVLPCTNGSTGKALYETLKEWLEAQDVFEVVLHLTTDGASSVFAGRGKEKSLGARFTKDRGDQPSLLLTCLPAPFWRVANPHTTHALPTTRAQKRCPS